MGVAAWTGALINWGQELAAFKAGLAPMFPRQDRKAGFLAKSQPHLANA
jgi:hypothetical protein